MQTAERNYLDGVKARQESQRLTGQLGSQNPNRNLYAPPAQTPFQQTSYQQPAYCPPPNRAPTRDPDAMEIDGARRPAGRKVQYKANITCYNCGNTGHYKSECPYAPMASGSQRPPVPAKPQRLQALKSKTVEQATQEAQDQHKEINGNLKQIEELHQQLAALMGVNTVNQDEALKAET